MEAPPTPIMYLRAAHIGVGRAGLYGQTFLIGAGLHDFIPAAGFGVLADDNDTMGGTLCGVHGLGAGPAVGGCCCRGGMLILLPTT